MSDEHNTAEREGDEPSDENVEGHGLRRGATEPIPGEGQFWRGGTGAKRDSATNDTPEGDEDQD